MEADSKMSYFRVRNSFGGESELQLHSLEHDDEVETRFKDTRFSMVYLVEADKFGSRHVMNILTDQLRLGERGIDFKDHQFIADCNPPEEGEQHWLHDVFFKGLGIDPEYFKANYVRHYFPLDDNQFITEQEKEELRQKYRYDRMRYQRFVEGKWVRDIGRTLFSDVFVEGVHVVGDAFGDDPQLIAPPPGCSEIDVGVDLGDMNHAAVFGVKRLTGDSENPLMAFDIIDEAVSVGRKISINDYVDLLLEKMDFWEQYVQREYGSKEIDWRFWSDSSSLRHKAIIGMNEALLIHKLSGGRIELRGVNKGAGSVAQRIVLVKSMLHDGRLFISANCAHLIEMLRDLEPARSIGTEETDPEKIRAAARNAYTLDIADPLKHSFDALSYMLAYESPQTLVLPTSQPRIRTFSMA
jgi:hypothetical protein